MVKKKDLLIDGKPIPGMPDYDKLVVDVLSVCIKALDSDVLPDGSLRDLIEKLAGELMLEDSRLMVRDIYEERP